MTDPDAPRRDPQHAATNDDQSALYIWARRLTQELQILDFTVDQSVIDELTAHSLTAAGPEAGPVTAFVVGYAAGQAAATGSARPDQAVARAAAVALKLSAKTEPTTPQRDMPESDGWLSTAQ